MLQCEATPSLVIRALQAKRWCGKWKIIGVGIHHGREKPIGNRAALVLELEESLCCSVEKQFYREPKEQSPGNRCSYNFTSFQPGALWRMCCANLVETVVFGFLLLI